MLTLHLAPAVGGHGRQPPHSDLGLAERANPLQRPRVQRQGESETALFHMPRAQIHHRSRFSTLSSARMTTALSSAAGSSISRSGRSPATFWQASEVYSARRVRVRILALLTYLHTQCISRASDAALPGLCARSGRVLGLHGRRDIQVAGLQRRRDHPQRPRSRRDALSCGHQSQHTYRGLCLLSLLLPLAMQAVERSVCVPVMSKALFYIFIGRCFSLMGQELRTPYHRQPCFDANRICRSQHPERVLEQG